MKTGVFLALLILFGACVHPTSNIQSKKKAKRKSVQEDEDVSVVIAFANLENDWISHYHYRTLNRSENGSEIVFTSFLDSTFGVSQSEMTVHDKRDDIFLTYHISKQYDTLDILANHTNTRDQHQIFYLLKDSIEVQLAQGIIKVFTFSNLDLDERWDETLYFSKDFGFIYSHYPYYKKKYELISHSQIDSTDLKSLTDFLKRHSGEIQR